jgi:hypothetical protein
VGKLTDVGSRLHEALVNVDARQREMAVQKHRQIVEGLVERAVALLDIQICNGVSPVVETIVLTDLYMGGGSLSSGTFQRDFVQALAAKLGVEYADVNEYIFEDVDSSTPAVPGVSPPKRLAISKKDLLRALSHGVVTAGE